MFGRESLVAMKELRVYVAIGDTEMAKNYIPNIFQFQKGELEKLRKDDFE